MLPQQEEIVTWINNDLTKMIVLSKINSFQFYKQREDGRIIDTLRCIVDGGDIWLEKEDAINLYTLLLERAKDGKFGSTNL